MLYSEIIAVCSQIHTKHINTVWAERRIIYKDPVRTAQYTLRLSYTNNSVNAVYGIIAVCSQSHTKKTLANMHCLDRIWEFFEC